MPRGERSCAASRLFGDLHKNFIGLDHAELAAGFFLDHFKAFLQVLDLGSELVIAQLRLGIFRELLVKALLHFAHAGNAAPAHPELRMEQHQQRNQNGRNDAVSHGANALRC